MATKIESYNASYPAAFYEIGTVYSFYGNTRSSGTPAKEEYIRHYSSALKCLVTVTIPSPTTSKLIFFATSLASAEVFDTPKTNI